MNFWAMVKKLNERGKKKMSNTKLECHLTEPHVLLYKISTYIYIYIDIDYYYYYYYYYYKTQAFETPTIFHITIIFFSFYNVI